MYTTHHKAARLRKKKKMKNLIKRTDDFTDAVFSVLKRSEFDRHRKDFESNEHVIGAWVCDSLVFDCIYVDYQSI